MLSFSVAEKDRRQGGGLEEAVQAFSLFLTYETFGPV